MTGCKTYNLSDNTKFREYLPSEDKYIVSKSDFENHKFEIEKFLKPDSIGSIQYTKSKDINLLIDSLDSDLLVLFFHPSCSGARMDMELVKDIEKLEIPYILVSFLYRPEDMRRLYNEYNINNKNQYIIPSIKSESNLYLDKILNFTKGICNNCYELYKDDLIFTKIIYVSSSGELDVFPKLVNGYVQQDRDIEWIKRKQIQK
jgi:hypothetical protein